jgi:hypothetical protein
MRIVLARSLCTALLFASLVLVTCSSKTPSVTSLGSVSTVQAEATNSYAKALAEIHLKSTKEYLSEDPEVLGYRAVLMVERAADLIVVYSEKIQANQIQLSDSSTRISYTNAFPVAVDNFNQTTPPKYMSQAWKLVFEVIQQYNQAYTALIKGIPLSTTDLYRLKTSRQILTNYRNMAEANLAQRSLGSDFLAAQHEAVEQHLQQAYGNEPVPTLLP